MNLNGTWQCRFFKTAEHVPSADADETSWQDIIVPFSPETAASGVERVLQPDETLVYQRLLRIPGEWSTRRILLNFEAVDYSCRCLVNGSLAGEHVGGYLPFSFDITKLLTSGENLLELVVADPTDAGPQSRGKQVLEPGVIWYTPTSGIWQTVWLEPVDRRNHIEEFRLTPHPKEHRLTVNVRSAEAGTVRIRCIGDFHSEINGESETDLVMELPEDLELWSPDSPILHGIVVELLDGTEVLDSMESYFALRTLAAVEGRDGKSRLALNGKPFFLNAPLDQGYWPESGLTAPSEEALLFDLEKTKELGFNSTRKHIKVESRRWYFHADRLGLAVVQDMISGGDVSLGDPGTVIAFFTRGRLRRDNSTRAYKRIRRRNAEDRRAVENELWGMMDHLHNVPSVLVWVPFNEGWGQFDAARIAGEVKRRDPSRLVDHASGWLDQRAGDFDSTHTYWVPLQKPRRTEKRVFFYSEYGGYNLAVPGHMWDETKRFGYRFLASKEKLEEAYTKLMRKQLIPLIGRGLSAAVYTQLTDVEIENNGYFTYDRKILKMDASLIRTLNNEIYAAFAAEWERNRV